MSSYFYTAKDIAGILHRSERYASDVIRKLNEELQKKGFETAAGRIPKAYFCERFNVTESAPKGKKTA